MSITYKDVGLLDQGFNNLGDSLLQNRVLNMRQQENTANRDLRQQALGSADEYRRGLLDAKMAGQEKAVDPTTPINQERLARADAAGQSKQMFRWTGEDNVKYEAPIDQFPTLIQAHPAKKDETGKSTLEMEGTTPDGVTVHQRVVVANHTDDSKQTAANLVKSFVQQTGVQPKPTATTSPRQEVHQVRNPERVVGGVVNSNVPPTLSLTNTVTPMKIGNSDLPNLAPQAAAPKATPTPKDVAYLAAHPEMKAKFEARFGAGSADQFLP